MSVKKFAICSRCKGNNYIRTSFYGSSAEMAFKTTNCPECTISSNDMFTLKDKNDNNTNERQNNVQTINTQSTQLKF